MVSALKTMNEDQPIKSNIMADKSTISDLRMEPANNGFIISYCEKTKKEGKNTYDNCQYNYPKEVFDVDDDSDEDIAKAFDRFKELAMRQYKELKLSKA